MASKTLRRPLCPPPVTFVASSILTSREPFPKLHHTVPPLRSCSCCSLSNCPPPILSVKPAVQSPNATVRNLVLCDVFPRPFEPVVFDSSKGPPAPNPIPVQRESCRGTDKLEVRMLAMIRWHLVGARHSYSFTYNNPFYHPNNSMRLNDHAHFIKEETEEGSG